MRRFIIDTDTASDDAAAIMIAAMSPQIDLLGVTIVAGNVGLAQAADNALMTLEVCGCDAPASSIRRNRRKRCVPSSSSSHRSKNILMR